MTPEQIEIALERILPRVSKPGRYTGGEYNQIVKNWDDVDFKAAIAFPDIYDLGMSNLGLMILYDIINKFPNLVAERVYSPWIDMEEVMRTQGLPLFSLETKHDVREFDLLAISLPYEQLFTNALNMMDLAGMPIRSLDRDESYPLVIAGGHACLNPEPMAPFIDVFVIGEGEEAIMETHCDLDGGKGYGPGDPAALHRSVGRVLCPTLLRGRLPGRWHDRRHPLNDARSTPKGDEDHCQDDAKTGHQLHHSLHRDRPQSGTD